MSGRAPRVTEHANKSICKIGILDNPYFQALTKGIMPLELFRRTQEQFFHAVTFFARPMAALIGRIPHPKMRLEILHNLVEEHGEFQESQIHHNTFQKFLHSIGARPETVEGMPVPTVLRAFNSILTCACVLDELEVGVACMGIIEFAFAPISEIIGKAVVKNGWVKPDDLVHYKLHAEIDQRHAEEFFVVIEPGWDDPARRYFILQGLELGAYAFDRLYRDLYKEGVSLAGE